MLGIQSSVTDARVYELDGETMKIGILHPGSMGVSVARSILNGGHQVYLGLRRPQPGN